MGSLSNYVENKILDHILKTSNFIQPSNLYIGLSTSDPLDNGSGISEPSGNGYLRVNHNTWDITVNRSTENTGTITFPGATGSWGTVTHFFISDNSTGGNLIGHGELSTSRTIGVGDNPSFIDGSIDVSFNSGNISTNLANQVLDHIFGNTTYDTTADLYIALSTSDPTDDNSGTNEPVGNAYVRVLNNTWDASVDGVIQKDYDKKSLKRLKSLVDGYDVELIGCLNTMKSIGTNDTNAFQAGALTITMD